MLKFYHHIVRQIIDADFEVLIDDSLLKIRSVNGYYVEPVFDYQKQITKNDIDDVQLFLKDKKSNMPLVKLWYLITHEKYFKTTITYDKYGRVSSDNIIPAMKVVLDKPIADMLAQELNSRLEISKRPKQLYLTCDYDIINIWDVWGAKTLAKQVIKSVINFNFTKFKWLIHTYFRSHQKLNKNNYLNTEMFSSTNEKTIKIGFFLTQMNHKNDGRNLYKSPAFIEYIGKIENEVEFGIHLNFETMEKIESIPLQLESFYELFGARATKNRHHYLRCVFPNYLKALEQNGITEDFSHYFAESLIFRSGTSSSFIPWDEKYNKAYKITVVPTTIMDGTFSDYLKVNLETAKKMATNKLDYALEYGRDIVLLWHNHTTTDISHLENNYHKELCAFCINYVETKID